MSETPSLKAAIIRSFQYLPAELFKVKNELSP